MSTMYKGYNVEQDKQVPYLLEHTLMAKKQTMKIR